MATQAYRGRCHCGSVAFEVDPDPAGGGLGCNCTMCRKPRSGSMRVSLDAFRLPGTPDASTGRARNGLVPWPFRSAGDGRPGFFSGVAETCGPFFAVRLACLGDADDAQLAAAPVRCVDGRHDDWRHAPSAAERAFL